MRLLALVGCWLALAGCHASRVLGSAPEGAPVSIAAARTAPLGAPVVLRGRMVEK